MLSNVFQVFSPSSEASQGLIIVFVFGSGALGSVSGSCGARCLVFGARCLVPGAQRSGGEDSFWASLIFAAAAAHLIGREVPVPGRRLLGTGGIKSGRGLGRGDALQYDEGRPRPDAAAEGFVEVSGRII